MAGMKSQAEARRINLLLNETDGAIKESVTEFLQRAADTRPRTQRRSQSLTVQLIGNELVRCFPLIRSVIPRVNCTNINWQLRVADWSMTPEMVLFFNKHSVEVVLSLRGRSEELEELQRIFGQSSFKDLNHVSVDSVLTAYSQDTYGIRAAVNELFGRQVSLKHRFLTLHNRVSDDLVAYDLSAWQTTCSRMAESALLQFEEKKPGWESDGYRRFINSYYDFVEGINPLCSCSTRGKTLTVDGSGRVWRCINGVYPIGTVDSECREFNQRSEENIIRLYQENKRFCGTCRWFPFCHGHCPREINTPQQAKQCEFMGIFFESVEEVMRKFESFLLKEKS